jgi:hypothetical protein
VDLRLFLRTLRSQIDDFVGETAQFDDLTMMCLEYRGAGAGGPAGNGAEADRDP